MNNPKIAILLSSYNGEKYIREQIDSILVQTYQNFELYIRDDGSRDSTLEVLKRYESLKNIHVFAGENVGYAKSFLKLVNLSGEADYYAFCDQDDVWLPEKLSMAVEILAKEPCDIPVLYFSNYDFYDENMVFLRHGSKPTIAPSFSNSLVDVITPGFSNVFNKKACNMVRMNTPKNVCGHDWWLYMLCTGFGKVVFDDRVTTKYRRYNGTVSPTGMKFISLQIWRVKKLLVEGYFDNISKQGLEFRHIYYKNLDQKNQKIMDVLEPTKKTLTIQLKKVFYFKRLRGNMFDDFALRCIFLLGKL